MPYIRVSEAEALPENLRNHKRVLVYDRAMQLDLLRTNRLAYMLTSPVPSEVLDRNDLIQRKCTYSRRFKDMIISRTGYHFSKLDRAFINKLYFLRNELAYGE